jgi:hypothetical protein
VIPDNRMEAVAVWEDLPPGEKQARLLDQALDRKREILTMPLPDDGDDSIEATRLRALILTAADSTINQTIALRSAVSLVCPLMRIADVTGQPKNPPGASGLGIEPPFSNG